MSPDAPSVDLMLRAAQPVIARVVGRRIGTRVRVSFDMFDSDNDEALEACSLAWLRLYSKFERIVSGTDAALDDFADYVASAAHSGVNEVIRVRAPQRGRFVNRLRRVLKWEARFAMWSVGNVTLAGFSGWRVRGLPTVHVSSLSQRDAALRSDPLLATNWNKEAKADWAFATGLLERVFELADGPLELHALLGYLTDLVGVQTGRISSDQGGDDTEDTPPEIPQPTPRGATPEDAAMALQETTARLSLFWSCLTALEHAARVALLLNLPALAEDPGKESDDSTSSRKKSGGRGEIAVLRVRGIASIDDIGRQLALTPAQYAQIGQALGISIPTDSGASPIYHVWSHLPVRDALIASVLGRPANQIPKMRERALGKVRACRKSAEASRQNSVRQPSVRAGH